jgi:predicted metal-dependent HD superfamily phosphohydrolase
MHELLAALHARWMNQWPNTDRNLALDAFGHLVARYSEPHRAYHNLVHINDVLTTFASEAHTTQNGDAVRLALWYHDAIYDYGPQAKDNELKSAEYAQRELNKLGVSGSIVAQVYDLIMATRHNASLHLSDHMLIADIDLGILGKSWPEYDAYAQAIRAEYDWVASDFYATERAKILQRFIDTGVYSTQRFRDRYGDQAKRNLKREIKMLRES